MEKEIYIEKIRNQYPYLEEWRVNDLYEIAKRELLLTLYSANPSVINENTQVPYAYEYLLLEAMEEIINIGNMRNFTSYSENGWSWKRDSVGLQTFNKIKSKAVIK